jgi:iron(III) transport system substrate-binding protein
MSVGHAAPAIAALIAGLAVGTAAPAMELPRATQAILGQLKLSPELLSGLESELAVPQGWVEGARKEGAVKVEGTWEPAQFAKMNAPFAERYPFLKVEYSPARAFENRATRPLIAMQGGRYLVDIVTGFGGALPDYVAAKALEDLRPLPGFRNPLGKDPDGVWAGFRVRYWCMAYNTKLVAKQDLPARWEDLLGNPAWHDGNIGLANRPELWLLMLWHAHGKEWTSNYIGRFFDEVRPQLRKEGLSALAALAAAGEFHAALPVSDLSTRAVERKGAPVAWHCPEPIPQSSTNIGILAGNPHANAARLWVNWLLSKEGQIAQFATSEAQPSHRDLQIEAFMPYAREIAGRAIAVGLDADIAAVTAAWNARWGATEP